MLLDAGAGEGQYRPLFSHTRYIGVDYTIGDPHWNYSQLNAFADLSHLPFKDNSFEAVLCTQVLEHIREPERVLKELHRVLKPGGQLILTAPGNSEEHQIPYDFYRYTSYGLQYLFEKAGFEILEVRRLGGHFWFLIIVVPRINTFLWGRWSKIFLFPLYLLSKLLLGLLLPLLFFYLDRFDREKKLVLNFAVLARKPL